MALHAQNKGKTGEREVAKALNAIIDRVRDELGLSALEVPQVQRNQNQSAVGGADLVGTLWLAIEIKRQEQLSINTWWKQAEESARVLGAEYKPVLIFKQNRKPWRVILDAELPMKTFPYTWNTRSEITWEAFLDYFEQIARHYIAQGEL